LHRRPIPSGGENSEVLEKYLVQPEMVELFVVDEADDGPIF
jgi:hypothetical protein